MNKTNDSIVHELQLPNLIVNSVLTVVSLYLLVAFSFFEYTTRYWNGVGTDERHNKIARILRILCIVGISFAFMHYVCELIAPFMVDASACQSMNIMWLLTYALGILTAYVFLWQRQHCLYEGPALKHLLNGYIKALSWIVLGFLILSAVMVFLAGSRMIAFSGCNHSTDSHKLKLYETILAITLLTLTILGQAQLLVLFIIPLRSHTSKIKKSVNSAQRETSESTTTAPEPDNRRRANTNSSPTTRKSIRRKESSNASIISLVKRCLILSSICMVGDVIAAAVTILEENAAGKLAYDINLIVNILCCLGSFKTWTSMVFPWKRTRRAQKTRERIVSVRYLHADTETFSI
uniref:uncharacterized protein LOC120333269 isoform X1 n=1 Tax=Styela clava TaxID=7725 RepID=UPI00193A46F7|nr:uncharacterized protein LOC120333269 isoform X1 [Styela clava]